LVPQGREAQFYLDSYSPFIARLIVGEYVSSVQISKDGQTLEEYDIRVNKPLKVGDIRIFQDSYTSTFSVTLRDDMNGSYVLLPGEGFREGYSIPLHWSRREPGCERR
jgi:hypothetical protein